jgi:hypothetical protein
MRTNLQVPFSENDKARSMGARWDAAQFILGQYVRIIGRPELLTIGAHKSASAKTADGNRISSLEAAVAEIRAAIFARAQIEFPIDNAATIKALKAELRNINRALSDPRVDLTMTASEVIKELRSALKVIHTWASFPESFDCEQTKRLCMSALGREE